MAVRKKKKASARKKLASAGAADLLVAARRRCCICFALTWDSGVKRGQIAHLDRDASNNDPDNLAFLCLVHHDEYDTRPSQSKGFLPQEVKRYRATLIEYLVINAATASPSRTASNPSGRRSKNEDRSAGIELRRGLKLRDRMRKDFIKPPHELMQIRPMRRPYEKFARSAVIIHEVGDTTYPEAQKTSKAKISGWFKVELYDFYFNGLVVFLRANRGVIDVSGNWKFLHSREVVDLKVFQEIKICMLGRIPWRNISDYDMNGDEYYGIPHVYCDFSDDGMPYEDFVYSMVNENYDWPLSKEKQIASLSA